MLEGLEIKEVLFSEPLKTDLLRLEAEFYTAKSFKLSKSFTGAEIIDFVQYGTSEELNEESEGYPVLRLNEFQSNFIGQPSKFCKRIDNQTYESLKLKKDDVLICRTNGNPKLVGKSAMVPKDYDFAYASYLFKIRPKKELINASTLVSFLNSIYGRLEIEKFSMASNQVNFSPAKFREMRIPHLGINLNNRIEENTYRAFILLEKSQQLYASAENFLQETIGLNNFEAGKEPVNIKGLNESFLSTGRLDAEYYQKKFDILEEAIRSQNHKTIKEIRTDNYRGMQPIYVENGDLDIINSKHILEDSLDYNGFEKTSSNYWDIQSRARVYKGDILTYTTGANIGRTQVYQSDKKALASNHVNIIRIKEQNPVYIGFVLNSLVGRMQTDKFSAGSAQAELYPKDLDEFLIPIIENSDQEKIAALVEESFRLKKQSEQLLETAKRAVELAIEQDEDAAMRYIENAGI